MSESKGIVLFIEDNPMQVRHHIRRLQENTGGKYEIIQCETLLHAVRFTLENHERIKLFVIDLYLPGPYQVLDDYAKNLPGGVSLNQGELFANFLSDRYGLNSFIFLTNLPEAYTGETPEVVFDKDPEKIDDFLCVAMSYL